MGRYRLNLISAFLCLLQCNLFEATNTNCNVVQLRIPISSMGNNQQNSVSRNVPYPYYPQLSQYYGNICNSCKGSICSRRCNSNNYLSFGRPTNALTLSVPTATNAGRTTITVDTRQKPPGMETTPDAAKPSPPPNGEKQNVNVVVKITKKNNTDEASTSTSAKSEALLNQNGSILSALTAAEENSSDPDSDYVVSVFVTDVNSGDTPIDASLQSQIIADDGEGDISVSKTVAIVDTEYQDPSADSNDSTVAGKSPPANSAPAPAPTKPEPAPTKPAPAPTDPAPAPAPSDPPAASSSSTSVAAADDKGAAAASDASGAAVS